MRTEEASLAIASAASKTTTAGAGITIGGFLLTNEAAVLFGMLCALAGVLVNWYYRRQANRRAEQIHQLRQDYIRRGQRTDTDLVQLLDSEEDD